MRWAMRWRRRKNAEQAAAAAAVDKQLESSQRQYENAKALSSKATEVNRQVKAEIQRNQWTDTLFGVIQTGGQ